MNTGAVTAACAIGAALLGAGSDMGFGFGHGEQVAAWTVRSYVSLDARQQQAVVEQLVAFKQWHCVTQPAGYAAWVRQAAADFAPGLTVGRVATRVDDLEYFARLLVAEAVPGTSCRRARGWVVRSSCARAGTQPGSCRPCGTRGGRGA